MPWNPNKFYQAWCLTLAFFAGYSALHGNFDALANFLIWILMFATDVYVDEDYNYETHTRRPDRISY